MNTENIIKYVKYEDLINHFEKYENLLNYILQYKTDFILYKDKDIDINSSLYLYLNYNPENNKHLFLKFSESAQTILYFNILYFDDKKFKKMFKIERTFLDIIKNKHCYLLKSLEKFLEESNKKC